MIPLFKVKMPLLPELPTLLNSGFIGQGKYVDSFEEKFAEYFNFNKEFCIAVNSCTSAIQLALELIDINDGDECLTTAYTCIATNIHIERRGLILKWYDVDKVSGLATLQNIKNKITKKTKVVIIVNISGTITKEIEDIYNYCESNNIFLIEDCAQSFGAKYNENFRNTNFHFQCYSFQAIKHMTTIDGGMLCVNNNTLSDRARKLRWFGFDRRISNDFRCEQDISEYGFKIHMTDINAYIGIESLKTVSDVINTHKKNSDIYIKYLKNINISLAHIDKDSSYWTFPIHIKNRVKFIEYMKQEGIQTSLVQNRQDNMKCFKKSHADLPNLDIFMETIVHIPCGWWLSENDVMFICDKIKNFTKTNL